MSASLASRIRAARTAQGRTQADCAEAAGMAQSNWARLERRATEANTPIETLRRVAAALGVELVELLS